MSVAGLRIKRYREENNLTLEEFGAKVGVGKSTVRKWECGDVDNIRRSKLIKIAEVMGVSPIELIGWEETPTPSDNIPLNLHLFGEPNCAEMFDQFSALNPENKQKAINFIKKLYELQKMEEGI